MRIHQRWVHVASKRTAPRERRDHKPTAELYHGECFPDTREIKNLLMNFGDVVQCGRGGSGIEFEHIRRTQELPYHKYITIHFHYTITILHLHKLCYHFRHLSIFVNALNNIFTSPSQTRLTVNTSRSENPSSSRHARAIRTSQS